MAFATGRDIGPPILRALGIDTKGVKSFKLEVTADSYPTITLTRFVKDVDLDETVLEDCWKRLRAVRIEKTEQYRIEEQ